MAKEQTPAKEPEAPLTLAGRVKKVFSQMGGVIVAAVLVITARASLADHYYVPSGSMKPTVEIGDRIIVDKRAYGIRIPATETYVLSFDGPARGDVVVLSSPEDGRVLLKRVVGLPGDKIEVKDGRVYLGGQPVEVEQSPTSTIERLGEKSHRVSFQLGGGRDFPTTEIPKDQYLVMGDNRGDSKDGRYFGLVDRGAILGHAVGMYLHAGDWLWEPL